jgi:hypothetical protein
MGKDPIHNRRKTVSNKIHMLHKQMDIFNNIKIKSQYNKARQNKNPNTNRRYQNNRNQHRYIPQITGLIPIDWENKEKKQREAINNKMEETLEKISGAELSNSEFTI